MRNDIITDHAKITWILEQCQILRLGLTNDHGSYVVPVHYGYEENADGNYVLYVHGTADGEKAAALDQVQSIGFETDHGHENLIYTPPRKGDFGPSFISVIGNAVSHRIEDPQAKLVAICNILHHYVHQIPVTLNQSDVQNVAIWALDVQNITGRVHNPTPDWSRALGIPVKERHGLHYKNGAVILNDVQSQADDADTTASASIKDHGVDNQD